jgi:hypothetical protein
MVRTNETSWGERAARLNSTQQDPVVVVADTENPLVPVAFFDCSGHVRARSRTPPSAHVAKAVTV